MYITVRNLSSSVTAHDLRHLFAPYGAIGMIHISIDRHTGRSRGCGSVVMPDRQAAQAAMACLQGTIHAGRVLAVHEAQPEAPRGVSSQSWW